MGISFGPFDIQVYHRTMLNDISKIGAKVRPRPLETNVAMDQLKLQIDRVRLGEHIN
jgi:hypothetical protein